MKTLYLLRGIPGCGKSTLARMLVDGGTVEAHLEADMYFIDSVTRKYNFDASKLRQAHDWCKERVEGYMMLNENIAVSNTFTQEWEMKAYYDLAKQYNYTVISLIVENRHGGENIHNVPEEALNKMENRFEVKLR